MNQMMLSEVYGDVTLSVQASAFHYCAPRVDGLRLSEYHSVEVAVMQEGVENFLRPSQLGVAGFDQLFEPGDCPVAGWVPQDTVDELRTALRQRAERNKEVKELSQGELPALPAGEVSCP